VVDRLFELRPAAGGVDVLDPQQKTAASRPRHVKIDQRRQGMTAVQKAIRARREAKDGYGHRD
jgi:hypothetical protein